MAGSQGIGSALILRAKEARARAQAADSLGLSTPLPSGQPGTTVSAIQSTQGQPVPPIMPGQPIQPPNQEPATDDMMYGHVEEFLKGLTNRGNAIGGQEPRAGRPPMQVAPPPGASAGTVPAATPVPQRVQRMQQVQQGMQPAQPNQELF